MSVSVSVSVSESESESAQASGLEHLMRSAKRERRAKRATRESLCEA